MEDDLYPLDGAAFLSEPQEQAQERKLEKGKAMAARPMLEDIIARFRERIALYDSVSAIPNEVKVIPERFMHVVTANELTKNNLISELEWLEQLLEDSNEKN